MKNLSFAFILFSLVAVTSVLAQEQKAAPAMPSDFHSHRGFHFEFGIGPAFGTINDKFQGYDIDFKGTGAAIQISLGGSLDENLILTFDILSKAISSPEVTINGGGTYPTSNDLSLGEVTYGGGLTYYVQPTDIFIGTTLGAGTFVLSGNSQTTRSKYGFSLQLRAGKHWWISKAWGVSLGATYGFTSCDNSQAGYTEHLTSGRFTIMAGIGVH